MVKARQPMGTLHIVYSDDCERVTAYLDIKAEVINYYQNLFGSVDKKFVQEVKDFI